MPSIVAPVSRFLASADVDRSLAFMERQEQLLERIATALERRNAR